MIQLRDQTLPKDYLLKFGKNGKMYFLNFPEVSGLLAHLRLTVAFKRGICYYRHSSQFFDNALETKSFMKKQWAPTTYFW